jgi:hypothetical protein
MVIPGLQERRALLAGLANDGAKIARSKARVDCDGAVAQLGLGFTVSFDDVDMRWLVAIGRIEEKAISVPSQKVGHPLTRSIPRRALECRAA